MKAPKKIGFFTAFILPALVITGFYAGGFWNLLTLGFVFIIITTVDHLAGVDTDNNSEPEAKLIGEEFYYRFITYAWTFVQVAFVSWACYVISFGKLHSFIEWFGFVVGVSLVTGGIGITVAHELGHKKSNLEQFYSKILLMTVCYMHFFIEHNRGHHVQVATPDDPATARRDETFYAFWYRSVFYGYAHAWQLEKESLLRKERKIFSVYNEMLWYGLLPIVFCFLLTVIISNLSGRIVWEVPIFFVTQSILAFTLLELVNYIEHYGIVRTIDKTGKYERVNPLHSWNASHLISNFFLFQLQRHSDHHANAIKRYQVLNHYDDSPQLPFGYPTMILIALVPPIWFSKMNPLLDEWREKVYLTYNP